MQRSKTLRKLRMAITNENLDILIKLRNLGRKVPLRASVLDITVQTVYKSTTKAITIKDMEIS